MARVALQMDFARNKSLVNTLANCTHTPMGNIPANWSSRRPGHRAVKLNCFSPANGAERAGGPGVLRHCTNKGRMGVNREAQEGKIALLVASHEAVLSENGDLQIAPNSSRPCCDRSKQRCVGAKLLQGVSITNKEWDGASSPVARSWIGRAP